MTVLTMGGNAPLPGEDFDVSVRWKLKSGAIEEIDVSAFILTASGKVPSDDDMIFYGQRSDKGGAVRMTQMNRQLSGGFAETVFDIDLRRLPQSAEKIAVAGTIADAQRKKASFSDVASLLVSVIRHGVTSMSFDVPVAGMTEAALVLGEFYRRNDLWKFRAVGQGYNGGLKPLAESFGVTIDDEPSGPAAPAPVAPSALPALAPVSLSKVTLTKGQPKISLAKKGSSFGEIKVNLNWNKRATGGGGIRGGFLGGGNKGIDLDLSCLFELKDGTRGAIQALGRNFGSLQEAPFIQLMADDRTGASSDGEWLRINGVHWNDVKRIMIFTMIYEGVTNWQETDGVVTVYVPDNAPIEVRLDEGASNKRTCAIVLLENNGGEISVRREVEYFGDAQDIDRKHGWGLRWKSGSK